VTWRIPEGDIDVLSVGEALVDFISTEAVGQVEQAAGFRRYLGGSVTNLAANVVRLGGRAAVAARVGDDPFGRFVRREMERQGIITDYLKTDAATRTPLVFVTCSATTADFFVYRGSDARLSAEDVPQAAIERARVVHTSAFALSQESSRTAVLDALHRARARGCLITLEPNYHPGLWDASRPPDEVLAQACRYVDAVKPSRDDCRRLFGADLSLSHCAQRFHDWGVGKVVLTQGARGVSIYEEGRLQHVKGREVPVADATGAGDAFWAGFLVAVLDGRSLYEAVLFGREVAEIKLGTVGPITGSLDREAIYRRVATAGDGSRGFLRANEDLFRKGGPS
jgi:sugar/nucleoside kinase (ribokinase family)